MNNSNYLLNYIHRLREMGKDPHSPEDAAKHVEKAKTFFPWPGVTFVLDLRTGKYLHLSNHFPESTQHHYQPLLEGGYRYFSSMVRNADMRIFDQIFHTSFEFIATKPRQDIEKYWFSVNFRVNTDRDKGFHILEHFIVSEVDEQGSPLLLTGICLNIDLFKTNNLINFSIAEYSRENGLVTLSQDIYYPGKGQELTRRECEITRLICEGKSNAYISQKLFISYPTAKTHRKNIYEKTSCSNPAELFGYYQNSL
jgi:DNA-binding CsgD family transcriptional regulator